MPAFRTKAGTGQAPTTTFLGGIADQFTMLVPSHIGPGGFIWDSMLVAAKHINTWTIFNTSFTGGTNTDSVTLGSLTTAPDGNNTGQKFVETTTNSLHGAQAGLLLFTTGVVFRLVVMAKAAERTRIVLYATDSNAGPGGSFSFGGGVKTVFDLAGNQIGVANTLIVTPDGNNTGTGPGSNGWATGPTSIVDFGNGWRLCSMDFTYNNINAGSVQFGIITGFYIDAGSGTAAENSTYVGDVTKGVYVWNSSMLPPTSFSFYPSVAFFDDFNDNTMANIDLTDSRAPGFNWYIHNKWPHDGFNNLASTTAAHLSVASSKLTISQSNGSFAPNNPNDGLQIMSAAYDGAGGFVGRVFNKPGLFEASVARASPGSNPNAQWSFWTTGLEGLLDGALPEVITTNEIDFFEGNPNANDLPIPLLSLFWGSSILGETQTATIRGYPVWEPIPYTFSPIYTTGSIVFDNTTFYKCTGSPTAGLAPHNDLGNWTVFAPASTEPVLAKTQAVDWTQQHTFSCVWLPATFTDPGWVLLFFDGILAKRGLIAYGSRFGGLPADVADHCHQTINFGTSNYAMSIDWVRVSQ